MMSRIILVAAAAIIGVLARYLIAPVYAALAVIAILALAWGLVALAKSWVRSRPVVATWLFLASYGVVFGVVAGTAGLATWLAISVPGWLPNVPEGELKTVSGVVIGALNALIAAAWLDNAKDEDGSLWPQARHKSALSDAFAGADKLKTPMGGARSPEMERLYFAVYGDTADSGQVKGWGFTARLARARIVKTLD